MTRLSGYLLANTSGQNVLLSDFEAARTATGLPRLQHVGQNFNIKSWEDFDLITNDALADEDGSAASKPYRYRVSIVRGYSKLIVLAYRRKISDYLVANVLDRLFTPKLRRVPIMLANLIQHCTEPTSTYRITSLVGRHAGPGRQVRTMSLYGEDVTDSTIFREHGDRFNFYSCGLGRRLFDGLPRLSPHDDGEIGRIGNEGFLSADVTDAARATELLLALRFLVRQHWVESWVPVSDEEKADNELPR